MASAVQICNMALSHIGSHAVVSSIDPPDGSFEAAMCEQFYGQVRTELLEMGNWRFALARANLVEVTNNSDTWAYAYALPSDCLAARRVLRPGVGLTVFATDRRNFQPNDNDSAPFTIEGEVVYTNEEDAVLLYMRDVTDVNKFTPSFRAAFAVLLASYLAGPIVKGTEGLKLGDGLRSRAGAMVEVAAAAAANASSSDDEWPAPSVEVIRR
jgi:hypothetical protein